MSRGHGQAFILDQYRRAFGNGRVSGELIAWGNFLNELEIKEGIFEFSGVGKHVDDVRGALLKRSDNDCPIIVITLKCNKEKCLERAKERGPFDIPFPYQISLESAIDYIDSKLSSHHPLDWVSTESLEIDTANTSIEDTLAAVEKVIGE